VTSVRPATTNDAAAIAAIYNEAIEERTSTFETRPRTPDEIAERIDGRYPLIVAELDGELVGWAGLSEYSSRNVYAGVAECSVYVRQSGRGRGIGTALCEEIAAEAERSGIHKLLGKLFPSNEASARMVRRCGFREVGTHLRHSKLDGEWRDVLLVERLLGEAAVLPPAEP
jgi:L-amino acid N-acyltransferase YncA